MSDSLFSGPNDGFSSTNNHATYLFPPLSLLPVEVPPTEKIDAACQKDYTKLLKALKQLKISITGQITYTHSHAITRFKVRPTTPKDAAILLKNEAEIGGLLSRIGVRIYICEERDKTIIVEIPQIHLHTLHLREVLESDAFINATGKLNAVIGADPTGSNKILDITKMPHMLIGGTTGCGKSMRIHNMILSLLYSKTPDEVRLVLIDPKKVEFFSYRNIPHLLAPVVTSPKKAVAALQATVEIMKTRFNLFEKMGVSNIDAYNQQITDEKLPYIVVVIDEFAELMFTDSEKVENDIAILTQKARATGIHLIFATQYLRESVLPDTITINIPTRIAMATFATLSANYVFGFRGSEKLNLLGDMLLLEADCFAPTRVQGCFVALKDVDNVCEYIRTSNAPVSYDKVFMEMMG